MRTSRAFIALVFATGAASAKTVTVQPGESIAQAVAAAVPGDSIVLAAGTHTENVVLDADGAASSPIELRGEPGALLSGRLQLPGSHWILRDFALVAPADVDAIQIDGSFNLLERLDLSGGTRDGIDGGGVGNRISDCTIHDFDSGVAGSDAHCIVLNPGAEDWVIEKSRLFDCSGDGVQLYSSGPERTIVNTRIEANEIYYSGAIGYTENAIDVKNADGLYILGNHMYGFSTNKVIVVQKGPANLEVRCNVMHDSDRGPEFRAEDGGVMENIVFSHNLVYAIAQQYLLKFDTVKNVSVLNNTFADSPGDGLRIEGGGIDGGSFRNNLWVSTGGVDASNFSADHNGYHQVTTQIGSPSDVNADPLLDAAYRLSAGSPMIDTGVDVGLPFAGSAPDIGFDELGAEPCGAGVAGTGGTAGSSGTSGAGGAATGGSAGTGGGSGASGSGGSAGSSAGSSGTAGSASDSEDDGGCGCRTAQVGGDAGALWLLLATACLGRRARRRR